MTTKKQNHPIYISKTEFTTAYDDLIELINKNAEFLASIGDHNISQLSFEKVAQMKRDRQKEIDKYIWLFE